MIKTRVEKISSELEHNEGFIVTSPAARQYLTGFKSSAGTLLITEKKGYLFIDSRYFEKATATIKHLDVILAKNTTEQISQTAKESNLTLLYTEISSITVAEHKALSKAVAPIELSLDGKIDTFLSDLRSIKDSSEINFIKQAQEITDTAFLHILDFIKAGKTENEIALELEFFMRKQGSEGVAFDTIAVSGKNSSLPHGVPTDKPVETGDFITMDFGANIGGYCSDMTRTVAVGFVNDKQKAVYNTVLEAQKSGLSTIKAGLTGAEVDGAARNIINNKGYGKYFGHALGHSLGLEVHEAPACSPKSKSVLKSGMLMTVEPGIYIPESFGVRIEDMVLITDDGAENLTHSQKELIIL